MVIRVTETLKIGSKIRLLAALIVLVFSSGYIVSKPSDNGASQPLLQSEQTETVQTKKIDTTQAVGPADSQPQEPTGLTIPVIDIDHIDIQSVGVTNDGSMGLPDFDAAGWYKFGPSPGSTGSAVVAGHIAFDNKTGVFSQLDQLTVGDQIVVHYDSGDQEIFEVTETTYYDKASLPTTNLFSRTGDPLLTLITCGGSFNPNLRSYQGNVVVGANPI